MELTEQQFFRLASDIVALGYDEQTAARLAAEIGDTPCVDDAGRVVVTDGSGLELARVKLT